MSETKRAVRGRGGREERRAAAAVVSASAPYITRKIPYFEVRVSNTN